MESFGARLKRERERQGIAIEDVAAATKIGARMLLALEEEHFDHLPGGIFNKGFVRAYARHLGLDENQAIADYLAAAGGPGPSQAPEAVLADLAARAVETRTEKRSSRSGDFPWGKLTILLLVIALVLVLWSGHSRKSEVPPARDSSHSDAPAAGISAPAQSAASGAAHAAAATPASAAGQFQAPSTSPDAFVVRVEAREDSWLSITADGEQVTHGLLPAGAQKAVSAHQEIVVRAGNVAGLDLTFNRKRVLLEGRPNEVRTLTFDATGLKTSALDPRQTVAVPPQ